MQSNPEIKFFTNFNNKMSCKFFLHVTYAPPPLPESAINVKLRISTSDDSHLPVTARLVDFWRLPLSALSSMVTFASHGMDVFEYYTAFILPDNPSANSDTKMAIYLYETIS